MVVRFVFIGGIVVAWAAWIAVLLQFDPFTGGWIIHLLFYASLGLALQGTLMIAALRLKEKQKGMSASRAEIGTISRQAFLFVTFLIISLILSTRQLLKWWNVLPLAMATLALEYFFVTVSRRPSGASHANPPQANS